MKSMLIVASLVASLVSQNGFAQTKLFEGFSLGLNANSATATTDFTKSAN